MSPAAGCRSVRAGMIPVPARPPSQFDGNVLVDRRYQNDNGHTCHHIQIFIPDNQTAPHDRCQQSHGNALVDI